MGASEIVGDGGVEINPAKSITDGARGRVSMGRVVAYGGDEGCSELSGTLCPFDFATLETLAFTRIGWLVDVEGVGWNEPLPRRTLAKEASVVEVKERCLDNS